MILRHGVDPIRLDYILCRNRSASSQCGDRTARPVAGEAGNLLPRQELGTTGLQITRIGFGAWAVGGGGYAYAWGEQDDNESIAAIRHAVESGINWIDTAAVYGLGHSEEIVRAAIEPYDTDDRPFVFTKCGVVWDPSDRAKTPWRSARPESVRRECEESLRRLGVERIDLYQVHRPPDDDVAIEDYWATMVELKAAGKVRAIGLSNHGRGLLDRAEAVGHVESLQPAFSAIHRSAAADELPWCADHGTGVVVYSPMQSGLLSGGFTRERAAELPDDDWRSRSADFAGAGLDRNLGLAAAMRPVARRHDVSVAAVAIAWTLSFPAVTAAIVGARRFQQVDAWLVAGDLILTDGDIDEIAEAIERTGAGEGPVRP